MPLRNSVCPLNKTVKPNIFRLIVVALSLLVFIIALTQQAVAVGEHPTEHISAFVCFLMGATAIIGGGTSEWLIWLANPLCLFSMIYLFRNNGKLSISLALLASLLALNFLSWKEILVSESGSTARIINLELGYDLWLTSILGYLIGIIFYFGIYRNISKPGDKKSAALEKLKEELQKDAKNNVF